MPSICLYFQVHQPRRLDRYSIFESNQQYFDDKNNFKILEKVANKCYRPTLDLLIELVDKYKPDFNLAFSISGVALEAMEKFSPDVITKFQQLAQSGHVEFLAETYYHSLSFLYSKQEFVRQVQMHQQIIKRLFDQTPSVFRNTELIFNNNLASYIAGNFAYSAILAEGAEDILAGRSPNWVYSAKIKKGENEANSLKLLLKNYRLSDDIAFRFSDKSWKNWPLTIDKFVKSIDNQKEAGELCNLFMDFETFGEHQWKDSGIFTFLEKFPKALLDNGHSFKTPSKVIKSFAAKDIYDCPRTTSWADSERDISAWDGNAMQSSALDSLYELEKPILESGDKALLEDWRYLTTSDHFYYMSTKYFQDQNVHTYFSPYQSPYDAYINFMNVLDNIRSRI